MKYKVACGVEGTLYIKIYKISAKFIYFAMVYAKNPTAKKEIAMFVYNIISKSLDFSA